jgi:hypothetical protein
MFENLLQTLSCIFPKRLLQEKKKSSQKKIKRKSKEAPTAHLASPKPNSLSLLLSCPFVSVRQLIHRSHVLYLYLDDGTDVLDSIRL